MAFLAATTEPCAENGSECYCDVIEGDQLSRATRTSLKIFFWNHAPACVVFGCSRTADPQTGIGLYRIPFFDDPREESIKAKRYLQTDTSFCTWLRFDQFQILRNNTQQLATTCNRVWKRTQHPTKLRPFAGGL